METYLITGGAGFIGSHFLKYLREKEPRARIINVDKLTYAGNLNNLKQFNELDNYIFIKEDICNEEGITKIFSSFKPDYVINFAAESHVDRSINDSSIFVKTNVYGTQVLLQSCVKYGIKKYVQISTDEVYGQSENEEFFTESSPLRPRNPYAASKAGADMLAQSYHTTYGLPVNITRCTNNYGPNQNPEKFIPMVIKHCLKEMRIPVYGTGKNMRDWIHVRDNCSAVYDILKNGLPGKIYNISSNNEWENIKLARLIIRKTGAILETCYGIYSRLDEGLIEFVGDRKAHDRRYAVDSSKLRKELGWTPVKCFDEGLTETIKWYIDNKEW